MTISEFNQLDARYIRDEREAYEIGWGKRADEFEYMGVVWFPYQDAHVYRHKGTGEYVYTLTSIGD